MNLRRILLQLIHLGLYALIFMQLLYWGFFSGIFFRISPQQIRKAEQLVMDPVLRLYGMDWWPASIAIRAPERNVFFTTTEFSINSSEQIADYTIPAGWQLLFINTFEDKYYYILKSNEIVDGESTFDISFTDIAGNTVTQKLKLTAQAGRGGVISWPDVRYSMQGNSAMALVNKEYRLPEDYEPDDLVALSDLGIRNNNSARIRSAAAAALRDMTNQLKSLGIDFTVTSGYRSYTDQIRAFQFWVDYNGGSTDEADKVSARPGHSEHQLGTTIDFVTSENGNIFYGFENTQLSRWLADNAWRYGFALSYPFDKHTITGYSFEPWHYRFIGIDNAISFHESGLTLVEWLQAQQ